MYVNETTADTGSECVNCRTEYRGGPWIVTTLVYRGYKYGPYCELCMRKGVSVVTNTYLSGIPMEAIE